jgi:hypothetical protein
MVLELLQNPLDHSLALNSGKKTVYIYYNNKRDLKIIKKLQRIKISKLIIFLKMPN